MENLKGKIVVKRTLADGTEKIYSYDQKKYNDKYYSKNKERLNTSIECALCKGTYCPLSKNLHNKSKRHLKFLDVVENINEVRK